ncbi:MAG TPA: PAS domain-containing sensor histidine kinase [Kiritimatiellia bacterium]|nr:PAS domain-containing sensor histidine kinase [Kiritimatiellia bacterium]HRU70213.1 PAS domain-containing sensor histidine kinase [Kiritimatiellia bacterium]
MAAREILGLLGEGVVIIDRSRHIVFVNRRAEIMFGYNADEMLGCPLDILLPEKLRERHALHVEDFFRNPRARSMGMGMDLVARRKNGETFPVEIGLSGFEIEGRELVIAIVTDITLRKKMQLELIARNEELDAFAHTVAHDLNGALTPIVGLSEMLADSCETLSPQALKEDLLSIARSGMKMVDIIKNLLLFASIRKEDVVAGELDMVAIVKEVLHRLHYAINERRAEIVVPEHFPRALGVAAWVEEIWFNYIGNGLKYGGKPPRLVLGGESLGDGKVRFWVSDNGPGIPHEKVSELFAAHFQINKPSASGYGLGLSIVHRIVDKLNGTVDVQSQPGQGSTFGFTLQAP